MLSLSACSNNKSNSNEITATPMITESVPTESGSSSNKVSDTKITENKEDVDKMTKEKEGETGTKLLDNENEVGTNTVDKENEPTTSVTDSTVSVQKLTTYYEGIGTLDDNYEFATSYIDAITSKEQISNYAKAHNLTEYEVADLSGMECYLIIPKYETTTIKVELFTDFEHTNIETILDSDKPVFVLCNPSDICSNVQITVSYDDMSFAFSPYLSLKDGTAILPEYANPKM